MNTFIALVPALLLIGAAYLLGSISSAIIVCRLMRLPDPRSEGSGNPGATNVLRIGGARGKRAAAITLFGDSLKGLLPVLVGHTLGLAPWALAAVGFAAFIGHLYPVFFGFRGGKGVATALGVQFGLYWPIGLAVALLWLFVARGLQISSASALVSMGLAPLLVWLLWPLGNVGGTAVMVGTQTLITLILFWRHRSNIRNLLSGTEGSIAAGGKGGDRGGRRGASAAGRRRPTRRR